MDNFIKNIKDKISGNTLVDMMKEAKVIDESSIKEQEVRRVLKNIDPNNELSIEDMATKLNDVSGGAKASKTKTQEVVDAAKSSLGVLQKFATSDEATSAARPKEEEPHPYVKDDNIFNLCDDFR